MAEPMPKTAGERKNLVSYSVLLSLDRMCGCFMSSVEYES